MKEKERKERNKTMDSIGETGLSGSRLVGVSSVEFFHQVRGMAHFVHGKPGSFFISTFITQPPDIVEQLASSAFVDFGIEDFGYFVFEIAFDFDWRGRRLGTVRDGTRCVRFEHGDMEYGVYGSEFFG